MSTVYGTCPASAPHHRPDRFGLYAFECVKAQVASSPKYPETLYYHGDRVFMVSGDNVSNRRKFKPENL